ncbi:MAG: radical SAM protein [Bacteroidales bacterium]|nr:radical SAM protein [Bacteroidales bacterium]
MNKKHFNIPVFIPEAACPFQCIYCNQRKISGQLHIPGDQEIIQIIESRLQTMPIENSEIELAYFGGNFTGFSMEQQTNYLDLVQPYIHDGRISGIRLSTRPDYISEEILKLLKTKHVSTIELGAQSLDDEVLKASKRGHTAAETIKASQMILEFGFNLGLQMMIGLPGDSIDKAVFTAHKIIELGATETRIYPTLVIRDTLLEKKYHAGKFQPLSLEEAIVWSAKILQIFEQSNVKVLKLGLHPSDGLLSGADLVAGPWHQSFRELVLSEIWREQILPLLKHSGQGITIDVSPKEINYAIGYKGSNKKLLSSGFGQVLFRNESKLPGRAFKYSILT